MGVEALGIKTDRCRVRPMDLWGLSMPVLSALRKAESGWKRNEEGKSRRAIYLCFRNGVDGVVGVDQHPD